MRFYLPSISDILRHPLGLVFLTILLSVAPSAFIPYSYLYRNFSLFSQALVLLASALFFFVALPLAIIKYLFNASPSEFGWRLPANTREAARVSIITFLALLPFILFFSTQEIFRLYYSSYGISTSAFLIKGVLFTFFYYFAEEFFIRGFIFFGLWHRVRYHSFWIVSLLFAFLHITKPTSEIVFSFFASLALCYLSLKTRSFLPAAIVHFAIALVLNVLATFVWYDSLSALLRI